MNHIDSNRDVHISLQIKLDIDNALETLTSSIFDPKGITILNCEVKIEFMIKDDDLKLLIGLRNVRRRQFQYTRDPAIFLIARQDLQKEIQNCFTHLRSQNFENDTYQMDPGSKPFWRFFKTLKKPREVMPALKDENKLLLTNCKKS